MDISRLLPMIPPVSRPWAAALALAPVLAGALVLPRPALAHPKGLYVTEAEAQQRALQLGCSGTHQNNGRWMPCRDEAEMHRFMRQE